MNAGTVFRDKPHPRMAQEKYYTPVWVTEALLRREYFAPVVWEPAAGNGIMARVLADAGAKVYLSDIAPDRSDIITLDFFTNQPPGKWDVVTNPPFGHAGALAVKFIERALELTCLDGGKVAMLLRDDFDSAPGRVHLFRDHPAWGTKLVLLERIRWTNLPQKKAGPSGAHAWYIWDWGLPQMHRLAPRILYQGRV